MTECTWCHGTGWLVVTIFDTGTQRMQRCDACSAGMLTDAKAMTLAEAIGGLRLHPLGELNYDVQLRSDPNDRS